MFTIDGQTTIKVTKKPRVIISNLALQKMSAFVKHCNDEIGWLGNVEVVDNLFFIQDVFLFDQEVHSTTCEIDETHIAKWAEEILMSRTDGIDIINSIRVWGHSHVNMAVSPSGQDEVQFERLANDSGDYYIRIIANKNGKLRLDFYDVELGIIYNNVQWEIESQVLVDEEEIKAEIKKKVTKKVYATSYTKGQYPYYTYHGERQTYYKKEKEKKEEEKYEGKYSAQIDEITDILDIADTEELIDEFGFTEDEIIEISQLMTTHSVKSYLDELLGNYLNITYVEASHIKQLCLEHVRKNYYEQ